MNFNSTVINLTQLDLHVNLILQVLTGFLLYTLTIWTILGNTFILIAISTNKQLKQNGNSSILIGNLAFSDLLLGVTVLPFSATFSTFKIWPFGQLICDIWLYIDVLCCTASIWGLLMIAFDRYIATNHPIKYRAQKNNSKYGIAYVGISWLISSLISLGPMLFASIDSYRSIQVGFSNQTRQIGKQSSLKQIKGTNYFTCVLFHKPLFVVSTSIVSFYFPLVLMVILYGKVFMKIRTKNALWNQKSIKKEKSKDIKQIETCIIKKNSAVKMSLLATQEDNLNSESIISLNQLGTSNRISNNNNNSSNDHIMTISQTKPDSANKENNKKKSQNHNHVNETRITKTLAIIMSSFLFCWLPFFIIYVIRSFLDDPELIEPSVMDFFIWLGYFNSCLDPILYVILNENFRETLTSIITCKWSHLDRDMKRTKI